MACGTCFQISLIITYFIHLGLSKWYLEFFWKILFERSFFWHLNFEIFEFYEKTMPTLTVSHGFLRLKLKMIPIGSRSWCLTITVPCEIGHIFAPRKFLEFFENLNFFWKKCDFDNFSKLTDFLLSFIYGIDRLICSQIIF